MFMLVYYVVCSYRIEIFLHFIKIYIHFVCILLTEF